MTEQNIYNNNDLIRRMDAVTACQVGPSDEWARATKDGYNQAATDCAMNILRIAAVEPAVAVKPLEWVGGEVLIATGPEIYITGHVTGAKLKDKYEADRTARILSAITLTSTPVAADPVVKLQRTIDARDRRISRLVGALNDARAKGYVTASEEGPQIVPSAPTPHTLADALAVPEVAALVEAVEAAWAHDGEPTNADIAKILDAISALRQIGCV